MQRIYEKWRQPFRAVLALVDYVEDHWYVGQAGSSITWDQSVPQSNPLARGYAQWTGEIWSPASRARSASREPIFILSARSPAPSGYTYRRPLSQTA